MKHYELTINMDGQKEITWGTQADSCAHAVELFAVNYCEENTTINKLGSNEWSVTEERERKGQIQTVEYDIINIAVTEIKE